MSRSAQRSLRTLDSSQRQINQLLAVHEIVSELSQQYRLLPGDLIYTGTPEGVGPVQRGDQLVGRIDGLQPLHVEIV